MTNSNPHILVSGDTYIDVSMLYNISDNDESFISKIVQTFLNTFPDTIKSIEDNLKGSNWENVYLAAHHAKSSLSIIKIEKIFDWVLQIEVKAKNQTDLDIIPGLVRKVKEAYMIAEDLLRSRFLKDISVE